MSCLLPHTLNWHRRYLRWCPTRGGVGGGGAGGVTAALVSAESGTLAENRKSKKEEGQCNKSHARGSGGHPAPPTGRDGPTHRPPAARSEYVSIDRRWVAAGGGDRGWRRVAQEAAGGGRAAGWPGGGGGGGGGKRRREGVGGGVVKGGGLARGGGSRGKSRVRRGLPAGSSVYRLCPPLTISRLHSSRWFCG